MGYVYLLHFDKPYRHARHYVGYSKSRLDERLERHRNAPDVRLLQVIKEAGIGFQVARIWKGKDGTRQRERSLKTGHVPRYCPLCQPSERKKANRRYRTSKAGRAVPTFDQLPPLDVPPDFDLPQMGSSAP